MTRMRMKTVAAVVLVVCSMAAFAQSPTELLKGRWVAQTGYCRQSVFVIDSVDAKGIVRGSFTCTNTKWAPTMGEAIGPNTVKGMLIGTRFVMVNADGGGVDLTLNGAKLEGTGAVKADSPRGRVTFVKQ